jgi:hypothetical protein
MKNPSDFPDFDSAYYSVLLPDNPDTFDFIAAQANFSIYHNDLWRGTARRFAEYIVEECAQCCGSQADKRAIRKRFGLPVEHCVQYAAPDPLGSVESQYKKQYNLAKIPEDPGSEGGTLD